MCKIGRLAGLLLILAAVACWDSCGYLLIRPMQLKGRVIVMDLPNGNWEGTKVSLTGIEVTYTNTEGIYTFDGFVNNDDSFELIITRPGYDGWMVTGTFPYDTNQDRSEKVVHEIEDIRLTRL